MHKMKEVSTGTLNEKKQQLIYHLYTSLFTTTLLLGVIFFCAMYCIDNFPFILCIIYNCPYAVTSFSQQPTNAYGYE